MKLFSQKSGSLSKLSHPSSLIPISVLPVVDPFITVLFAGSISQAHLEGVGLASTLFTVLVISMSAGYVTVFDTYGPQVYGSPHRDQLGTVLVKCLLQGGLVSLIMLGPFLNVVYVIDLLPESVEESAKNSYNSRDIAVQYVRIVAVIDFLEYALTLILKYFAVQGKSHFTYVVSLTMIGSFILANYTLVTELKLGVVGLGLAAIIGRVVPLTVSVILCIIKIRGNEFIWTGLSSQVLIGWKPMILLGISGSFNFLAELALLELSSFLSQFDGTITFTVVIIVMQISNVAYSLVEAIASAGATLIGTALGEGSVKTVKIHMVLKMANTLLESFSLVALCFPLRSCLVGMFNQGQDVVELFNDTFWLVCVSTVTYHINYGLLQGILVAFGKQSFIARSKSIACYGIGLPIVMFTIFCMDLKVIGVISVWIVSDLIIIILALYKISKIDIQEEIENTGKRVNAESVQNTEYSLIKTSESSNNNIVDDGNGNDSDEEGGDETCPEKASEAQYFESNQEIRYVLAAFFISAVIFVILAGISFCRSPIPST